MSKPSIPENKDTPKDADVVDLLREAGQAKRDVGQELQAVDAFREQRKASLYWLRKATEEFEVLDKIEDILPSFVRRRYRIGSLSALSLSLWPQAFDTDDPKAADALHADVNKLFIFLIDKCEGGGAQGLSAGQPTRTLTKWNGQVGYSFTLYGLPGFEKGLRIEVNGLPAGSTCHITKKVTGYRMHEESEYEMVCGDEPSTEAAEVA